MYLTDTPDGDLLSAYLTEIAATPLLSAWRPENEKAAMRRYPLAAMGRRRPHV